jgi:sirohydrochlorin cobaltochelatase
VVQKDFHDAALVLVGHGSTVNAQSGRPVYQHAAELRQRSLFAEVRESFWKQEPQVKSVVVSLTCGRVFVVPVFISDGYFSEEIIPGALGFHNLSDGSLCRVQAHGSQTLIYCRSIGSHDSMTDVLLRRAREVVERAPFPRAPNAKETTLFICGHGTEQNDKSRDALERQVERIRDKSIYAAVQGVYLEEDPRVERCYEMALTRNVIIVPFFISDGLHTQEDIPVLLGEPRRLVEQRLRAGQPTWRNPTERKSRLIWYSPSIGNEPHLADVILERVHEAAMWPSSPG